ncbi:MAG: thiamine pyrophosphate-binding protein, partial [Acidobacteria bacterium]|nr:thiamine pyrophosphate-binding protein [Acidobacteriota bacterium]
GGGVGRRTVAEGLLDRFHRWGARVIFAVPGAQVDPLLVAAAHDGRFRLVLAAHEQGAGYMADGFARMTGGPAVAVAINGPGATNMVTAAVTARMDRSPVLFLTGDSPSGLRGCGCFQGSDAIAGNAILRAAVGDSVHATRAARLFAALDRFERRLASAPRPLHLNVPVDLLAAGCDSVSCFDAGGNSDDAETGPGADAGILPPDPGEKSALLVGEEVRSRAEMDALARFAEDFDIPVACTFGAKRTHALLPERLRLGLFGYAGGPRAYRALLDPEMESLFVIGAPLDERNTAAWHPGFFHPGRNVCRFSADPESRRRAPRPVTEIAAGPMEALRLLRAHWDRPPGPCSQRRLRRRDWCLDLNRHPLEPAVPASGAFTMSRVFLAMREVLPSDSVLFLDSGDHRIHAGFFWWPDAEGMLATSPQYGAMGWAIGAAIGASFAAGDRPVWVITGDGCMQMHGLEMAVAARYRRRVVFLVSNNRAYGRIAARMGAEPAGVREAVSALPEISWTGLAESTGVRAHAVASTGELRGALAAAAAHDGPSLVEMMTAPDESPLFEPAVFTSCVPGIYSERVRALGQPAGRT